MEELCWPRFVSLKPNTAHATLANWEEDGLVGHTITQNVDGLHTRAGSSWEF